MATLTTSCGTGKQMPSAVNSQTLFANALNAFFQTAAFDTGEIQFSELSHLFYFDLAHCIVL